MLALPLLSRLKFASGIRGFFVSFVLGAVCNLGHAPFFVWPVFILGIALFMLRLDGIGATDKPARAGFGRGLSFGLGYFLFGFYWIGSAFIARGPDFIPIMPFAVLLFATGLALFWAVAGAIYAKLCHGKSGKLRAPVFAALLFLAEYARGHMFGGLPWNLPGYVFEAGKPISQLASFMGIYGLSALAFFIAASLALWLEAPRRSASILAISVVALLASYIFGAVRLNDAVVEYVPDVKLRIVHANIPQRDKFDPAKYIETANHYLRLSVSDGFEDITHIIWPEGAVPGLMLEDQQLMNAIEQLFRSGSGVAPVFITQSLRADRTGDAENPGYYNSAAAISFPDNAAPQISAFYDKRKLVPFGEFIPAGDLLEKTGLKSLSSLASMTPAKDRKVPVIPGLPLVSIQICYEIIFPGFTPTKVQPGGFAPEWILNLSNDAWYGDSTGPRQHINQVGYRAIEEGLPVVRSTSGGISGVLDAHGRIIASRGLNEDGVLDAQLPRVMHQNAHNKQLNPIIALIIFLLLITCGWILQQGSTLHPRSKS